MTADHPIPSKRMQKPENPFGLRVAAHNTDHSQLILGTGYQVGDRVLFSWSKGKRKLLYGKPLEDRAEGESVPLNGLGSAVFSPSGKGVVVTSSIFVDTFSLGYIDISNPGTLEELKLTGTWHKGAGEMVGIEHLFKDHYLVELNIDGCSWVYEGIFDEKKRTMTLKHTLVGAKPFDKGMLERLDYNKAEDSITVNCSRSNAAF